MTQWPGNPRRQRTTFGDLSRSKLMARIRSRGNKTTEKLFSSLLRKNRIAGWRRNSDVTGHPDFIWPTKRVSVFIDGCFWHGHTCGKNIKPKTNAALWQIKIAGNKARDAKTNRKLRRNGWSVIRIWECRLANNPANAIGRIRHALRVKRKRNY